MGGREVTPAARLDALVAQIRSEFQAAAAALPPSVSVEQVGTWLRWAVARDPDLLRCTPGSIVQAVVEIVRLGLPVAVGGLTYLVRYGQTVQPIVGWKGLVELARRSGAVDAIDTQVVYDGDLCEIVLGTGGASIRHVPALDHGPAVAVYAWARLRSGVTLAELMSRADVEKIRRRSRAAASGPWVTDWEEMARKTVLRRLCKRLPQTPELVAASALDQEADERAEQAARVVARSSADALRAALATAPDADSGDQVAPVDQPTADHAGRQRQLVVRGVDGSPVATVTSARQWAAAVERKCSELESASTEEKFAFARHNISTARQLSGKFPTSQELTHVAAVLEQWLPPEDDDEDDDDQGTLL